MSAWNALVRLPMRAPRLTYWSSGNPASAPADSSTTTPAPSFASASQVRGTSATRRSPGKVSRGTPMVKATNYLRPGQLRGNFRLLSHEYWGWSLFPRSILEYTFNSTDAWGFD